MPGVRGVGRGFYTSSGLLSCPTSLASIWILLQYLIQESNLLCWPFATNLKALSREDYYYSTRAASHPISSACYPDVSPGRGVWPIADSRLHQ